MSKDSEKLARKASHTATRSQREEAELPFHPILDMQRRLGNRAVVNLLEGRIWVQPKLRTSESGDEYEQEADRVAEQVLSLSVAPGGVVQRKCAGCSPGAKCASCEEERVQRKAKSSSVLSTTGLQIQRAPNNGAPAPVTGPASAAGPLIVEDDAATVATGQMRKSEFLQQLRSAVCATADEALKEAGESTKGCPYLEQWLGYYADREPAHIERALRKYAPEAATATSAREYIPAVSNRVRRGVETWAKTGELTGIPDELQGMLTGPGAALGAIGGVLGSIGSAIGGAVSAAVGAIGGAFSSIGKALFKRKDGHAEKTDDPREIQSQLSGGQPLNGEAKSRMGGAFGHDFSAVRVHTNSQAGQLSEKLNARAFTVGSDIAFGPGEYQPGTMIGDALIAHELAHVVQQNGGASAELSQATNGVPDESATEADADSAAVSVVSSLWSNVTESAGTVAVNAIPRLRSGLSLSRCPKKTQVKSPEDIKTGPKVKVCKPDPAVTKLKSEIVSMFKLSSVTETGEACWTAAELTKMKGALARIPTDQRDAIAGVSLVRVEGIADCGTSGPQGCFRQRMDPTTGARNDSIEISDSALALDKDFEDGSKSYRTDRSGTKIETLPSQDVLLHEVGHAVESATQRAAESARAVPEREAVTTQDKIKTIVEEITRAKPPAFRVDFSTNKAEVAYQKALLTASDKVGAMVDSIGDPSNATAGEIEKMAKGFKKALPKARASIDDLKKKKLALPKGSSVVRDDIDGAFEAQVIAAERLALAFDARLAAQEKLDPAAKAEARANVKIKFKDHGTDVELDITRRLAELVALVNLKGINIKKSGLEAHPTTNWPNNPEELYADLYQWSISEPGGLKAFDKDIAKFYESPIGPKGTWDKKVDAWIAKHS